jgi:hypothetical protein
MVVHIKASKTVKHTAQRKVQGRCASLLRSVPWSALLCAWLSLKQHLRLGQGSGVLNGFPTVSGWRPIFTMPFFPEFD